MINRFVPILSFELLTKYYDDSPERFFDSRKLLLGFGLSQAKNIFSIRRNKRLIFFRIAQTSSESHFRHKKRTLAKGSFFEII
ncbi:MAG: hypothetical protein BHW57_01730 [Azospirillum sp. 47_25]|nr:MAG: hypothetical protein BHW57_01730 [Azospirillum sp. 47_25]PWM96085.1 MAG: hypothetical protein DBX42_02980 [Azospirillum sp.]